MMGGDEALGGTGKVSGGNPVADKQIPPAPAAATPPAPPPVIGPAEDEAASAIPLRPPAQNDGS